MSFAKVCVQNHFLKYVSVVLTCVVVQKRSNMYFVFMLVAGSPDVIFTDVMFTDDSLLTFLDLQQLISGCCFYDMLSGCLLCEGDDNLLRPRSTNVCFILRFI